eukprot:TRINITY_DN21808_c0_g1_i1.p1 TRINITY_DN21808_c0_g1~~TRINITY_DN21808_c0_g1_i1.p1  ORF type:complete len:484 (-),score=69.04 TRINITY_DN21808_c0_g1_i1:41-1492(-)
MFTYMHPRASLCPSAGPLVTATRALWSSTTPMRAQCVPRLPLQQALRHMKKQETGSCAPWLVPAALMASTAICVRTPKRSFSGAFNGSILPVRSETCARGASVMQNSCLQIDGSILEGGGQILRMSSAYAAIFGMRIEITKIRAGRKKPGLAAQHLESLRLVRDISSGVLDNDSVGSCEVTFQPGLLRSGHFTANPRTAGSITLMVQAALFPLLFSGGDCVCTLHGGTDVAFSPPLDFLCRVLLPSLRQMGACFDVSCSKRGLFPKGGGKVELRVPKCTGQLKAIDISDRGTAFKVHAVLHLAEGLQLRIDQEAAKASVYDALKSLQLAPEVSVDVEPAISGDQAAKYWVDIVVETTSGSRFHGGSDPRDLKTGRKGSGKGTSEDATLKAFVEATLQASVPLTEQLGSGAAVDHHLLDQLILPASLASGRSRFLSSEPSLHARTAIHFAKLLVPGVQVSERRQGNLTTLEIDGVGHKVSTAMS